MDDDKQLNDNDDQSLNNQADSNYNEQVNNDNESVQPIPDQTPELQQNYSQSEEHLPGTFITKGTKTKRRLRLGKKPTIIILIILALLIVAGAVYWFFIKDSNKSADQPKTNNSAQKASADDAEPEPVKDLVADNVVYTYHEKDTDPVGIYWRPASGGERNLVMTLPNGHYMGYSDIRGQYVAFNTTSGIVPTAGDAVWFSSDGGKSYKKVFTADNDKKVMSLKISASEPKIAISYPNDSQTADLLEINPNTQESKKIFSGNQPVLFVEAYDSKSQRVVYSEASCYGCGDQAGKPVVYRDIKNGTDKEIIKSTDTLLKTPKKVNADFTEIIAMRITKEYKDNSEYDNFSLSAPYSLIAVDIARGQEKTLATFGEKQTNPNTDAVYSSIGYMADGKTPYYVLDKRIFMVKSGAPSLLFESPSAIYGEYFVSANDLVIAIGPYNNFNVIDYLLRDQKNNQVLSGDDKTTILGITTK